MSTSIMDFYIYDSFTTDQLQINISGAGDIKIKDRADIKSFKEKEITKYECN